MSSGGHDISGNRMEREEERLRLQRMVSEIIDHRNQSLSRE